MGSSHSVVVVAIENKSSTVLSYSSITASSDVDIRCGMAHVFYGHHGQDLGNIAIKSGHVCMVIADLPGTRDTITHVGDLTITTAYPGNDRINIVVMDRSRGG